jgi:tetratricopeptide (TPR) repeat protein
MRDFFYNARFARGEYGAIEEEARKHLKEDPTCSVCVQRLVGILMVQKRAAEADETLDLYAKALRKAEVEGRDEFLAVARLYRLYLADDMSGYEEMARKVRVELTQNYYVFVSLLEQEKADQAVELIEKAKDLKTGYAELLLAALLYRVGRVDESNAHLADAVELVRMQGEAGRIAAALLSGELPIAVESAADLSLQDSLRLILLVSLAQRNPEQRKALLERAALLNVNPDFPCRFVKRSIAAMQQEAQ